MNDRTFPETSDIRRESTGDEVVVHFLENFGTLRDAFGNLQNIFGYDDRVLYEKTCHSQDKNLMPLTQKKLAGIIYLEGAQHPNRYCP